MGSHAYGVLLLQENKNHFNQSSMEGRDVEEESTIEICLFQLSNVQVFLGNINYRTSLHYHVTFSHAQLNSLFIYLFIKNQKKKQLIFIIILIFIYSLIKKLKIKKVIIFLFLFTFFENKIQTSVKEKQLFFRYVRDHFHRWLLTGLLIWCLSVFKFPNQI